MNIGVLVSKYIKEGYSKIDALAKVAQDIILLKISKSNLSTYVTIKGGVVMHFISNDKRRATRDIDFDFIKYSLNEESIKLFIEKLNNINDGVNICINGKITKLKHQDYNGKRVFIKLIDKENNTIETKLDIGVHKDFEIIQEEYCFDLNLIGESAVLLINSCEQIFTEKLKSLLKHLYTSTRYKDIFDLYYLIKYGNMNEEKLKKYIDRMIFNDDVLLVDTFVKIYEVLVNVFNNESYITNMKNVKNNWIEIDYISVINTILDYLKKLYNPTNFI